MPKRPKPKLSRSQKQSKKKMESKQKNLNKYIKKHSTGVDSVGRKIINTCKNCFKGTASKKYNVKDKKKRQTKVVHKDPSGRDTDVTTGTTLVTGRDRGDKKIWDIMRGGKINKIGILDKPNINIVEPDKEEKPIYEKHHDYTSIT